MTLYKLFKTSPKIEILNDGVWGWVMIPWLRLRKHMFSKLFLCQDNLRIEVRSAVAISFPR